MSIIKIIPNKPLTVSLLYASAKEKPGRNGVDFMYTLQGGHALFVPPIAHDEIQKLHAGPGEPFTLLKTIGQGNQAVWKVERIVQPGGQPSGMNRPVEPLPVRSSTNASKSITNGNGVKPVSVMPATAPTLATPQSKTLIRQLIATIDAVKVARDYAKQQGVDFEPTSRDICALAITGGIQVFKEGVY
jgi:hypothetical protein